MLSVKWNMSVFALGLVFAASSTLGATFTVTNLSDGAAPGPAGSLRKAFTDANGLAGADTIVFQTGLAGTITLTSGQLTLTSPVTITGPGANLLTVSGANASRVFAINSGVTATISDLTIASGYGLNLSGGGIENSGTLTLTRCVVKGCTATGNGASYAGSGGGIANRATLSMTNCTISNNSSVQEGAGIANIALANLTAANCTISANLSDRYCGGLWNRLSTASLTNCTFHANQSTNSPDALTSGAAVLSTGVLGSNASVSMMNCTVTGNFAAGTGAGGIQAFANAATSTITLTNTLVAGNTRSTGLRNFIVQSLSGGSAVIVSGGHNLDSDGTSGFVNGSAGNIVGTSANPINAMLGTLADNGGPTMTQLPLPGSPAIDAGDPASFPAIDQRGFSRPQDGNGDNIAVADIGAVEIPPPDCNNNSISDAIDIANHTSADCDASGVPDECEIAAGQAKLAQWADSVINFSSEYTSGAWSAHQATGQPDTFAYGDYTSAWAPSQPNGTLEFITLGFKYPVFADGITVRETLGNGMVYRIDLLDTLNQLHTIWTGVDPSQGGAPVDFKLNWSLTAYRVKGVMIYVNTNHDPDWEEIDAVQLRGSIPAHDCSANGVPDHCDIADGSSKDCNQNGVPDECDISTATSQDCDGNGEPDECEIAAGETSISQWAGGVIDFSSQFSNGSWSAQQATGQPNTFAYGDYPSAWAPLQPNGATEFITLTFAHPVYAEGVTVRETLGNGMVYQIDLLDTLNQLHTIWTGVDPSQGGAPVDFQLNWPRTGYRVKGVKIYVNTDHDPDWEEIDAVQLRGVMTVTDCNGNGIPDPCEPDADGDLVPDACDLCPNTIPGATVDSSGCPPLIPADFDRDGDVDSDDVNAFIICATRSGVLLTPACATKDFDNDGDGDMEDFATVQRCYSGAGFAGNSNCAN